MLKAMMTKTSETKTSDVPTDYEALRDILIAIRYMCTKRMVYPVITAGIEQRNDYLVMTNLAAQVAPRNRHLVQGTLALEVNVQWLLRVFTKTALHFGLKPLIVEPAGEYRPLASYQFDQKVPEFAYRRRYEKMDVSALTEIRKPRIYTLNGVDYNGVQVTSPKAEEIQSRETGGREEQG